MVIELKDETSRIIVKTQESHKNTATMEKGRTDRSQGTQDEDIGNHGGEKKDVLIRRAL